MGQCMMHDVPPNVLSWLPTIERAREIGLELPAGEPSEAHKLAALIVLAGAVRREAWDEVVEEGVASHRASLGPPAPPSSYQDVVHAWVVGPVANRPGCVRLRHTRDRPVSLCELYFPTLPIVYSFEAALEKLAQPNLEPPPELRCPDLRPENEGGSAYRGGGKLKAADFFGFGFGDSIQKGAEGVARLGVRNTIFLLNVRAYAWPFLWLRYPLEASMHEMLLTPARNGELALVLAPED
jgi:hypothetical protein